jgi:hypothetical protein
MNVQNIILDEEGKVLLLRYEAKYTSEFKRGKSSEVITRSQSFIDKDAADKFLSLMREDAYDKVVTEVQFPKELNLLEGKEANLIELRKRFGGDG